MIDLSLSLFSGVFSTFLSANSRNRERGGNFSSMLFLLTQSSPLRSVPTSNARPARTSTPSSAMPKMGKKKKNEPDITNEFGFGSEEDDESSDEEGGSDDDDGAPIYKVVDEDGQEALVPPVRYQARSKAKIRITSAVDSDEVGVIEKNEFITVSHTKDVNGQLRLRFPRGWTSYKSAKGYNLMLKEGEENTHYKQRPGKEIDIRKEMDPASEVVGKMQKLTIIEALEVKEPEDKHDGKYAYASLKYVKMHAGWISTHEVTEKMVGGVVKGIVETANVDIEGLHDPEGETKRAAEAVEAAKAAKIAEKEAKKLGKQEQKGAKKGAKAGLKETKAEYDTTKAFVDGLTKTIASLPPSLEETMKADLETCAATAKKELKRLETEMGEMDGSNITKQKAEIVACGKWEKQLSALLASMPESMVAPCAADIKSCKKVALEQKKLIEAQVAEQSGGE